MALEPAGILWGVPIYTSVLVQIPLGQMLIVPPCRYTSGQRMIFMNSLDVERLRGQPLPCKPLTVDSEHSSFEEWVAGVEALLTEVRKQQRHKGFEHADEDSQYPQT